MSGDVKLVRPTGDRRRAKRLPRSQMEPESMNKMISDRGYGWVIVAAGGLIGCIAAGAMFALAVYLQPIALNTGWSRA
jgi:hypothetical protein